MDGWLEAKLSVLTITIHHPVAFWFVKTQILQCLSKDFGNGTIHHKWDKDYGIVLFICFSNFCSALQTID
uniref:Uncharacterized protein n=1 Tax=Arundo donax TaxID=35708 RepID=A0A0A9EUE0_ARUDO